MSKGMPQNKFYEKRIKDELNDIRFPLRIACKINKMRLLRLISIHVKTCFVEISVVELAERNNQKIFLYTIFHIFLLTCLTMPFFSGSTAGAC